MPTYQGLSTTIFTMGLTAALAWELPHEPIHFNKKNKEDTDDKKKEETANKRVDNIKLKQPMTYYQNPWSENYITASKSQYISKNPNVPPAGYYYPVPYIPIDYQNRLPAYKNERVYYEHRDVHRRTRRDLFEKIEKFFMA